MRLFANAASILGSPISALDTTINLLAGDGDKFPSPTGNDFFDLTIYQKSGTSEINYEIVRVTQRIGDALTVTRGVEGTTPRAYNMLDPIENRLTAAPLLEISSAFELLLKAAKSVTPVGTLIDFSGTVAPAGYMACPTVQTDLSRTLYSELFDAIGTSWGIGDGSTTFGMPWFANGWTAVQANGDVGSATVGEVISHSHWLSYNPDNGGSLLRSDGPNFRGAGSNIGYTGGTANKAAGMKVMKCVKYTAN